MANLDIAEMRLPQDGRIRVKIEKKFIDLRISSVPTIYGEKIVLRISDKTRIKLNLKVLGFSQPDVELIERSLSRPLGLILAVGPSGCGKTTTLYTLIEKLNSPRVNIITTEDPVEYQIKGINQSQINPKIGLTFANSLKYLFRQNPDIIMVGEIRDQETAQTAVRGAITGHLMLSSLHCNDAVSTITRLFNMGVEPYLLASALRLVIAQRLVKKICSECKQEKKYLPEFLSQLGLSSQEIKEIKFYHGVGCEECDQSGYRGQTAVYEILVATPEILNLIFKKAPLDQIKQVALRNGMKPIFHSALLKAKAGITTLEEVMKVSLREE
jgi:type II secretory ATPase GspE/PulE/Tfp pilus assembly ATPase PilB-like protein